MASRETALEDRETIERQIREFHASVITQLPIMSPDERLYWIGRKRELGVFLAGLRRNSDVVIAEWTVFWQCLGVPLLDVSGIVIPPHQPGFDRVLVIPRWLTTSAAYALCKSRFACSSYYGDDLDAAIPRNDRDPKNGSYAIRVRDRVEADEELKNLSAEDLTYRSVAGITFLEREVFELKYHEETGKHLDIKNWTLCSGSQSSAGRVPLAHWHGGRFYVRWLDPQDRRDDVRSRGVVSL